MRIKSSKRITSWLICMMLIVATAFSTVGCNTKQDSNTQEVAAVEESSESKGNVLGEGQTMFLFTGVDKDGNETNFEIHTDKETVGEADQTYWALYVDGEYAMSGVDVTTIEEGKTYALKVEK